MAKYFLIWIIIWVIIAILVSAFGYGQALGGVGVAALISLFFMIKMLADQWSGVVVEIKKVDEFTPDEDGGETNTVEYAFIKQPNGKIKKIQNMGYIVGEKLEKLRGSATVKVIK